jgi:hypothetical protein
MRDVLVVMTPDIENCRAADFSVSPPRLTGSIARHWIGIKFLPVRRHIKVCIMGKKNKTTAKLVRKFAKSNKLALAALGGVATGIAVAGILGNEKAKELLNSVEDGLREFGNKVSNGLQQQPGTTT